MAETLVERIHALARKCAEQDALLKSLIAEVNVESLEKPYTAYKADPADIELNKLQDGALVITDSPATTNFRLPNIGEIVTSITPLDDPALHLLDGARLSMNGMYKEGLEKIVALQNTHPNLFITEAAWQTSVATYNVCGKFVYDSVANTVRLPLVTGFMEGTVDSSVLGDLVEAGLPNIDGSLVTNFNGASTSWQPTKAFYDIETTNKYYPAANAGTGGPYTSKLGFDASRSSTIYGNSTTVQPQSIKGFIYIVLANTISTPVVADIQREVDSKVNAEEAAHAALPSDTSIALTLPATGGTVTAPADGYIMLSMTSDGSVADTQYMGLMGRLMLRLRVRIGVINSVFLPVVANEVVTVLYTTGMRDPGFYFIYANGSAPANP